MCIYLLRSLQIDIKNSKSNAQKRKIQLLKWSMAFIFCFFANVVVLIFVPFWPEGYPFADLCMQLVLSFTVWIYFRHWEVNLNLFIKNRLCIPR